MNRAIRFRIYPTTEQSVKFAQTFGCCRKVWNLMLGEKIDHYKSTGKTLQTTPAKYKEEFPYLRDVDSLALANVQLNLQTAYKAFWDKKRKRQNRFPKFKSKKHARKSYTTNNQNGTVAIVDGRFVKLPKIGLVKAVIHRQPEDAWKIKSATVSQESDGSFFVSVLFEFEEITETPQTLGTLEFLNNLAENSVGLDYKSDGLFMDDTGRIGTNHKFFRESHARLAKAQQKLARKVGSKKGETPSANFRKQQRRVNRIHRRIARQRQDNLHKLSTEIANRFGAVFVESLDMRAMSNKGFGNGKATMDNGYGKFLNFLEYKLADRGKIFQKVDKWFPSSQLCSCCGNRKKLELSQRVYVCEQCGLSIDRDQNSAINIKMEGLRILGEALLGEETGGVLCENSCETQC